MKILADRDPLEETEAVERFAPMLLGLDPWLIGLSKRHAIARGRRDLSDDLYSAARLAIWQALLAGRYDPARSKLITFATFIARSAFVRHFDAIAWPVYLPANRVDEDARAIAKRTPSAFNDELHGGVLDDGGDEPNEDLTRLDAAVESLPSPHRSLIGELYGFGSYQGKASTPEQISWRRSVRVWPLERVERVRSEALAMLREAIAT